MKIAILGTRGIPNNYGGFEQCAEMLSAGLVAKGHNVTVYNPDFHPYKNNNYLGVSIKHIYSPQNKIGTSASNFIFDYLCLKDAIKEGYDIILELGLITAAPSIIFCRKKGNIIVTNLDGLEWKRAKWNPIVRFITRKLERFGVYFSNYIVADNIGIKNYVFEQYGKESEFIAYGAEEINIPNKSLISKYINVNEDYFLTIARLEPENNIELICDAYLLSDLQSPYYIIGNVNTTYGNFLIKKYKNSTIIFLGAIFNKDELDSFRYFSKLYIHGHSVGGTNPALLEAMTAKSFILCHDNKFNKSVIANGALYFDSIDSLKLIFNNSDIYHQKEKFIKENLESIEENYRWNIVVDKYENYFKRILNNK